MPPPDSITSSKSKCQISGCAAPTNSTFYDGKSYCPAHYEWCLFDELTQLHREWQLPSQPPDRFKYLLGRLGKEGFFKNFKENGLRKTTVAGQRTRNFKKTPDGCTFEVTRHPGAIPNEFYCGQAKVQTWQVDIPLREFILLHERDKVAADPDPEW